MPLESLPRHMFPKLAKWRATSLSMWDSLRNRFVFVCTSLAKGLGRQDEVSSVQTTAPAKTGSQSFGLVLVSRPGLPGKNP